MNFTREDVLRELELLPVWKLRASLTTETQVEVKDDVKSAVKTEIKAEVLPAIAESSAYICTTSDDKKWAFIWPASHMLSDLQRTLFSNILVALKIAKSTQLQLTNVEDINASVIIVMGEVAAQQVLNTKESIEDLRCRTHLLNNIHAIVTYHPSDMLHNLQLKSKAWGDFCLAKSILFA